MNLRDVQKTCNKVWDADPVAAPMTPKQRTAIAKNAVAARWAKEGIGRMPVPGGSLES
jgi:hypothetical protein